MEKKARVFKIEELIHGGRPLTATYSLYSQLRCPSFSTNSSHSSQTSKPSTRPVRTKPNPNPNPNPNPRVLSPLNYPAIIIGTLTLPAVLDGTSASNSTLRCSYHSCFRFSDGSATICCDILDLDLSIIGKKIRVLGWNFIPIKGGGGFLEIIRWSFSDLDSGPSRCLSVDTFSLAPGSSSVSGNSSKFCIRLHGALEFLSPISVVPCISGAGNSGSTKDFNAVSASNLRGFLVQIMVCECRVCNSKESITILNDSISEQTNHSFTKPHMVYFIGSASSWHPVITKLIGSIVTIQGLKKKLVYVGNEESRLMYVTAEKSDLRLHSLRKKLVPGSRPNVEGKGECGSYTGIVKGVYMRGMVVELDNEVWLLLNTQQLTAPHSLRTGALLSVKNVHFVRPDFSWTKMLILGACCKTSITVECFSPLITGCHMLSQSRSMLGTFIESLALSARLWVLLLISCFRKKFADILSEKEILGSKHKEGLVQSYASSHVPSSMFRSLHGAFMSLCKLDSCGSGCDGQSGKLKLVVPVYSFIQHCEVTWMRRLQFENKKILQDNNLRSLLLCEGDFHGQPIRKVFSSEDIGIVLIGSLKISPSSGRLQLVDATGGIDVIIPDLPSTWNSSSLYEVVDYSLVIEGMPGLVDYLGLIDKSFSCRNIFNFIPSARDVNLTVYVYFHLQDTACRNISFYPRIEVGEHFEKHESGIYHLFHLIHKFPMLEKFQGDTVTSGASSIFAEAVIFSWNLFVSGKDGFICANSGDQLKKRMEHSDGISKKPKINHASSSELSALVDIPSGAVRQLRTCSNSETEFGEEESCCNFSSREISCYATIRGVKNHRVARAVILRYTGANLIGCGFCRPSAQKVLMEFKPESFHIYQFLQIGCYYITEHGREDSFCNFKDSDLVGGVKILVTSKLHLWSLSFSPDDIIPSVNFLNNPPFDNSCSIGHVASSKDCNELCLRMSNGDCLEASSDVSLCLPSNMRGICEVNMSELEEGLIEPTVPPQGVAEVFQPLRTVPFAPPLLPNTNCLLPEGNLISLRGQVVAAHYVDRLNCQNLGDPLQSRFFSGVASTSCFHVLVEHQIVRIVGSLSRHVFPPGFGPGVNATFHRVLEQGGEHRWMLTPVSFIVINSIREVNESCSENPPSLVSSMNDIASLDISSLGLISELVQQFDSKLVRFRCRVVSINTLVFANYRKDVHFQQKFNSKEHQVDILIAGLVLDDGSSPCYCWADGERAATFLRLHEYIPKKAFESNDWTLKGVMTDNNTCHTFRYHLGRILENYDRISVKNFGSLFDSSYQDLAVSVSPNNTLSSSDENFLKFLVFNACSGTFWTIVASLMDSDVVGQLEKENLVQSEMCINSMRNIWVKEVRHTNPLTEARNVIQELLNG